MSPDAAWDPYDYPYTLYNLGGSLANDISSLLSLFLYLLIPDTIILPEFFAILFVLGLSNNTLAVIVSGIPTDGHNILSLRVEELILDYIEKQAQTGY
ncbi:MAG: hypothetical protein PHR78_03180 [Eubacteriales bacterium]|nr:hypothetical protein [Eubacteriales bacterium]MDD4324628.1 hypothetical protein [Eubacteriales bacterium]MDD4541156.1 hypothetical protein [Eubacteriales bacterium]